MGCPPDAMLFARCDFGSTNRLDCGILPGEPVDARRSIAPTGQVGVLKNYG
jgi:hypothetical protein